MQEIIVVEFGDVGFSGKLRPSQVASSEIIREQLMAVNRALLPYKIHKLVRETY